MDLQEFERAVIAGELTDSDTDFEYYFKEAKDDDIRTMQRICIENNVYTRGLRKPGVSTPWMNQTDGMFKYTYFE